MEDPMRSNAVEVEDYLDELPPDRRQDMRTVRALILENLPPGFEEVMNWGMITYQVPLSVFPNTYNGQPLMVTALASQKNYMSLYLTNIYTDQNNRQAFELAYQAAGKRLDAGKSCVRFKKLADLPLPLIAQTIAAVSMEDLIKLAQSGRKNKK